MQSQDSTIAQLNHKRSSLPLLARISALEVELRDLNNRRVAAQTRVSDLEREQAKADDEVELVKTRRARDEQRLNSGAVSNPKDLANLQHEVVALDRRIATLEDVELEVMEALESAQEELSVVTAELDEKSLAHAGLVDERTIEFEKIDADLADAVVARDLAASTLPEALTALYEKVRASYGGLGAAALKARRCEGCRLELNGADLRELAAAPADEVLRCPECSRILVRTPQSGI